MSVYFYARKEKRVVREFKLLNEKGQEYSLMDIENYCLLTEPERLRIFLRNRIRIGWKYFYRKIKKTRTRKNTRNSKLS